MKRHALTLAMTAALGLTAPLAQALTTSTSVTGTPSAGAVTFTFVNLNLAGFEFSRLTGLTTGLLSSVSVNATLTASEAYTYADDLTIYVDPLPLSLGGLLQVGGYSSMNATERHSWANGDSSSPGTTVIDTVTLTNKIAFTGGASDPAIYIGNGYGDPDASGTWTGSITLNFVPAVPEPETWMLMLGGGLAVAAWSRRGRRRDTVSI